MARIEIVVDGTDAAGKTPLVRHLVKTIPASGPVVAHAPYHVEEVYPLWDEDPVRAARIIVGHMAAFRDAHPDAEVIVWDRGWPTMMRAARTGSSSHRG